MTPMRVPISISRSTGMPLSRQIRDQIVAAIGSGQLAPGHRMPAIRELAEFLGINRNTVAQVYRQLESEAYLDTRAGGGTTVADRVPVHDVARADVLRGLVRDALRVAETSGFSSREFAEFATQEFGQSSSRPSVLVIDEYGGELSHACETIRATLPGSDVHGTLVSELACVPVADRCRTLRRFDFGLVPFYCLDQATTLLSGCDLPTLVMGVGPSLTVLEHIRAANLAGRQVAVVCSDPAGPERMERSLRHAGIDLAEVRHAHLGQADIARVLATADLVIASEASAATVRRLGPGKPLIVYSTILREDSLNMIRDYAERVVGSAVTSEACGDGHMRVSAYSSETQIPHARQGEGTPPPQHGADLSPTAVGDVDTVAKFFHALADPSRLRLLGFLVEAEHTVTECVTHVDLSQSQVSRHLACLADCGYVDARRVGRNAYYKVADSRVAQLVTIARALAVSNHRALRDCDQIKVGGN
ncbi:MAG: metalloregulator ArsR/SmtB family transcription factor [Micromonosporaceae bacterium]|nr:metalloregulator ArsR/SmtB family transcription factor [Micromonosporaceae bacterium]